MSEISDFTSHNVVSTNLYLNQKSEKKQINVLNIYNLSDREFEDDQSNICVYKVLSVWWWNTGTHSKTLCKR